MEHCLHCLHWSFSSAGVSRNGYRTSQISSKGKCMYKNRGL